MTRIRKILSLCVAVALFMSMGLSALAVDTTDATFIDVEIGSAVDDAIKLLNTAGTVPVVNGVGQGIFNADRTVTTAELVTFIGRLTAGEVDDTDETLVDDGWSTGYIAWAKAQGYITDEGQYAELTTEQVNAVLSACCTAMSVKPVSADGSTRGNVVVALAAAVTAKADAVTGTQVVEIKGFEWGPSVTKTIITLSEEIAADSVSVESFLVTETKQAIDWSTWPNLTTGISSTAMVVTNAYASDAEGVKTEGNSNIIALELYCSPNINSPYYYDLFVTAQNNFADPYNLRIGLTADSTLTTSDGTAITALAVGGVDFDAALIPQMKGVETGSHTGADGLTLTYGGFAPANADDGEKHPLVIWLHGKGEGGTDPSVAILGNEVTALYDEEFQSVMGGAYVLVPQCSEVWARYDKDDPSKTDINNPGTTSMYTETLMELIEAYVAENPAIDTDRIYIGGCSNGGYMTINMVLEYPGYFAAAYPICEGYMDSGISDEELEILADIPMWFVYAKNDDTAPPHFYSAPTLERLRPISDKLHTSIFEDVHDTTGQYTDAAGNPYQYSGHWSWIYFFNNQCIDDVDNTLNMWEWLAAQHK